MTPMRKQIIAVTLAVVTGPLVVAALVWLSTLLLIR